MTHLHVQSSEHMKIYFIKNRSQLKDFQTKHGIKNNCKYKAWKEKKSKRIRLHTEVKKSLTLLLFLFLHENEGHTWSCWWRMKTSTDVTCDGEICGNLTSLQDFAERKRCIHRITIIIIAHTLINKANAQSQRQRLYQTELVVSTSTRLQSRFWGFGGYKLLRLEQNTTSSTWREMFSRIRLKATCPSIRNAAQEHSYNSV